MHCKQWAVDKACGSRFKRIIANEDKLQYLLLAMEHK